MDYFVYSNFGSFWDYTIRALLAINLAVVMFLVWGKAVLAFSGRLHGSLGAECQCRGFWANWQLKSIKERLQDLLLATSLSLREDPRQSGRISIQGPISKFTLSVSVSTEKELSWEYHWVKSIMTVYLSQNDRYRPLVLSCTLEDDYLVS